MKTGPVFLAALLAGAVAGSMAPAGSKPARCATTDDGVYACTFRFSDDNGSFEISAPDRPTYILTVTEPGVAWGFINMGGGNVALPGEYRRSPDDGACWQNSATQTRICAW